VLSKAEINYVTISGQKLGLATPDVTLNPAPMISHGFCTINEEVNSGIVKI
jgi:hypothetical protein